MNFPHVGRWMGALQARPAVQRGLAVMAELRPARPGPQTEEQRGILFGCRQFARR